MNPFAAVAVKVVGGGAAAALLSLGVAGGLAQAASPSPSPSPSTAVKPTSPATADSRADRRAVRRAVVDGEAAVLGIPRGTLVADLRHGQKVADLAKDKGMTQDQFAAKLVANLKPRLAQLVSARAITQAQADRVIDRISSGHVPFWDGIHRLR